MKKGFTLAEVLITLAIIGVVAALTIPAVVQNYREKQTVVQLKRFYSQMSQAFNMARINEGAPENWGWTAYTSDVGSKNGLDKLVPYLKIAKYCGLELSKDCFPNVTYKYLNGDNWVKVDNFNRYAKAKLADGTMFVVESYSSNCEFSRGDAKELNQICALIHVDINGYKAPNQLGRDYFTFYLTKNGIIPAGMKNEPVQDCSKSKNGFRCAAWVVYKENMDYLRHDVSW